MSWMLIVFLVLLFLVVLGIVGVKKGSGGKVGFPYIPTSTLFSEAERSFLIVLDQAVGQEYRIFGKVRVADVAKVKPGLGASARQGALNKVALKHFDYIVCRQSDLAIACVVELNDKSHNSKRARDRDSFIDGVCEAINLPILKVPAKKTYSIQDIADQFQIAIHPSDDFNNTHNKGVKTDA